MQVLADAREGCHMACEVGVWRADGLVGSGLEFGAELIFIRRRNQRWAESP